MIGDSESDLEAARRVGSPSVLVSSGVELSNRPVTHGSTVVHDIYEAVEFVLAAESAGTGALAGFDARAKR